MEQKLLEELRAKQLCNPNERITLTAFINAEDNTPSDVWHVTIEERDYVLKKAKGYEAEVYTAFFSRSCKYIPHCITSMPFNGEQYLLLEYVSGNDLCRCEREALKKVLDALISLQNTYWETTEYDDVAFTFEKSLVQRKNRMPYLKDPVLEAAYERFLCAYQCTPRTLCHDDLLPFNIIVAEQNAYLSDWETCGMLPYPTPFARLIAHTQEDENALFYMRDADKAFAIDYYYDKLLKEKGVLYQEWLHTLEYFLFYEYCEWVFVGNKYQATDGEYYKKYLPIARKQAAEILNSKQN